MTRLLPPPDPALRASIVVPARDEETLVGACLAALAAQREVEPAAYEVVLVLDGCTDATAARAAQAAVRHPELRLHVLDEPAGGVGRARRLGMDVACERLLALDRPGGLVVSTDADSVVEPGWLAAKLRAARAGARAIGGDIVLVGADDDLVRRREARRAVRLAALVGQEPDAEHPHFSGASIAVTAEAYRLAGGLEPRAALEDEAFERALVRAGVPILRTTAPRVATSARASGRAFRGLARDLAMERWRARRDLPACNLGPAALAERRTASVSVIVPARECAATVGPVVEVLERFRRAGAVDELLVIDAASADGTAAAARAAGAEVIQEGALLPEFGPCRGKGDAMWRALSATTCELVAFLDADTADPHERHLAGLLEPLFADPGLELVKGAFARPLRIADGEVIAGHGGRVTELMARPLLNLHRPELAGFAQPLAGEVAARRALLERLAFPVGYGVEIAMLLDAAELVGVDALAQADLGTRQNRHQPLRELSVMSYAVLVAATRRLLGADAADALAPGPYVLPGGAVTDVRQVPVEERPPLVDLRATAAAVSPRRLA
jgi:glucosyl-3-phosphoglycerate synthase